MTIYDVQPVNKNMVKCTMCSHGFAIDIHANIHIPVGHYRATSEMPFKWHFAGGPIVARDCIPPIKYHDNL